MTKREILDLLAPYDDDQYVYVRLHSNDYPGGSVVFIQGVVEVEPWRPGPKNLIGLAAHAGNKELPPEQRGLTPGRAVGQCR